MSFTCTYCFVTFESAYRLKRHISEKHPINEDEGETSQSRTTYKEEPGTWEYRKLSQFIYVIK